MKDGVVDKLLAAPTGSFHVLESVKAAGFHAKTMFIPGPEDVAQSVASIQSGTTKTMLELRRELAMENRADMACPCATLKYWKWLGNGYEALREGGSELAVPWWRVLPDGKLSRHTPGGVEGHRARLAVEGVHVR